MRRGLAIFVVGAIVSVGGVVYFNGVPPPAVVIGPAAPAAAMTCDSLLPATERTGNWWCIDGTASYGAAISAVGSPTTEAARICPNGPNCGSVTGRRVSSGNYYASANTASPTGDFSCFFVGRTDTVAAAQYLVTRDDQGSNRPFIWRIETAAGAIGVYINATSTFNSTRNFYSGAINHAAFTYDFVTSGASVGTQYVNGAAAGTQSTMVGPASAASGIPWTIGAASNAGGPWPGIVYAAGCTEKVLSAAMVAASAAAAVPPPQTSAGVALSTTRNAPRGCPTEDDGAATQLPLGVPCVARGGLDVQQDTINRVIQSETLNTSWTCTNVTVTANSTTSPTGTMTADTLATSASGAFCESTAFTANATSGIIAVSAKTASSTQSASYVLRDTTAGADRCTGTFTASTSWQRIANCSSAALTSGNNHVIRIYPGTASASGTIIAHGAQYNTGLVARPYCITTTAAATCNGDSVTAATASSWPTTKGRVSLRFAPRWTATSDPTTVLLDTRTGSSDGWYIDTNGAGKLRCASDISGGASFQTDVLTWTAGQTYRIRCEWSGKTLALFRDDVLLGTAGGSPPSSLGASLYLGAAKAGGSQAEGLISDVVYETAPSAYEVGWIGDSITQGIAGAEPGPPLALNRLHQDWRVVNYGVSGDTISQISTRWTSTVRPRAHRVLVIMGGVNDLIAGTSGATIYTTYSAILDAAKADGMKVVVLSILPFGNYSGWGAPKETERLALNASLSAWCSSNGATYINAATTMQGASAALLSASYDSGDGLHPNAAGSAVLASLVSAVLP